MKLLITGANGFVGKNLQVHLNEIQDINYTSFTRDNDIEELDELLADVDVVIHLAGINRPQQDSEFKQGNVDLTEALIKSIAKQQRKIPIIYSSSIQAEQDNPYGRSKKAAEDLLIENSGNTGSQVKIYRLANVFGKWCKPNYNSMVATFCHNITRDLPVQIHNHDAEVNLVYVDDVVNEFISTAKHLHASATSEDELYFSEVSPTYKETVGDIAKQLNDFKESRSSLVTERVGSGFTRKLYATYVSYLPKEQFTYQIPKYGDERGAFVEMLKTKDSGQFSYFTAHPGITRGGHYHHTKNEKFLVIKGKACFRFKHMVTGEFYELFTNGETPEIVETAPGWSHDITNVGDEEMIVMLWANEIFDRDNPDTYASPVGTQ
ncbi:UDP-2-acetamido-2,6-beta-L-arabino-hexul-4-ose reductase [Kangiella sp. M94]